MPTLSEASMTSSRVPPFQPPVTSSPPRLTLGTLPSTICTAASKSFSDALTVPLGQLLASHMIRVKIDGDPAALYVRLLPKKSPGHERLVGHANSGPRPAATRS